MEWVAEHPIQDSHIPQPKEQVKKVNRYEYKVYSFEKYMGLGDECVGHTSWPGIQGRFPEEGRTAGNFRG